MKAEESRDREPGFSGRSIAPSAPRASNEQGVTTRVICLRNFTGSARGSSALPPASPSPRLLHVSFARTLVAAPRVCACKSQREVVTTESFYKRAGHARCGRGFSHMYARRTVNLFAKKKKDRLDRLSSSRRNGEIFLWLQLYSRSFRCDR